MDPDDQPAAPRWALMVEPHNRIRLVLLERVAARKAQGWFLIGAEDDEMFGMPQPRDTEDGA
jgi:hypothetical protein